MTLRPEMLGWSTVPSTAVLQLQAEHKGQTYRGTVSGFSLWFVGSVASEPVAKQRIIMQRLCSRNQTAPFWHPGSSVRRGLTSSR